MIEGLIAAGLVIGIGILRIMWWAVDRRVRARQRRAADEFWVSVRSQPRFSAGVDCFDD